MSAKGLCATHYVRQWRATKRGAAASDPVVNVPERVPDPLAIDPAPLFRYRAWHRDLRQMFAVNAILYPGAEGDRGRVVLGGDGGACALDDVILMTGAGFATRSGSLYDGDIVRDDRCDPPGLLYRVAFHPDAVWHVDMIGGSLVDSDILLTEDGPHIDVVGNIYENPDFLAA